MEISYVVKFAAVVMSMILADVCWTYYFIEVSKKRSVRAGIWSVLVVVFGALTAINYVNDNSLIIAAVIGSFIGTTATVEFDKRRENKK